MEFLECKICNIPYDEEEHWPRHAPCGHGWCSACIRELINNSIFVCPKCRQENQVNVPEDLPVNFDLIDVIRAFKAQNISLPHKSEPKTSGASNTDVCKVHHKIIGHRCLKCERWLCDLCLNYHTILTDCNTISSSAAMKNMKDKHTKSIDVFLSYIEEGSNGILSKIQDHNDRINENTLKIEELTQQSEVHGKEILKNEKLLEQIKHQKGNIANTKQNLIATNSPYTLMDKIEVLEEIQQELHSWSITNLGVEFSQITTTYAIYKVLKGNKDAFVEIVIKDQKIYGKLSQDEENIYFHSLQAQSVTSDSIVMPFANLQKLIPSSPSLMFMELSLGGVVKGLVHLHLEKDLPNIREHMVQLVTGQQGHTLAGITFNKKDENSIHNPDLPFKEMLVTADSNARSTAKKGDVMGNYSKGYLESLYFQIEKIEDTQERVIGCIESGMDIIQECHNSHSQGVVITDCGLVLEKM